MVHINMKVNYYAELNENNKLEITEISKTESSKSSIAMQICSGEGMGRDLHLIRCLCTDHFVPFETVTVVLILFLNLRIMKISFVIIYLFLDSYSLSQSSVVCESTEVSVSRMCT